MVHGTSSEMDYGAPFIHARMTDIAQNLLVSNIVSGASVASCTQHIRITKFGLRNQMSVEYFQRSAASTFGFTHLDERTLASCSDSEAVHLMKAVSPYLLITAKLKGDFPCCSFCCAAYSYVQMWHASFEAIRSFSNAMFVENVFDEILGSGVPLTHTIATIVFQIFLNNMKLFLYERSDHQKLTKH